MPKAKEIFYITLTMDDIKNIDENCKIASDYPFYCSTSNASSLELALLAKISLGKVEQFIPEKP